MPFTSGTVVRTVGLQDVQAKLVAAAPNILANNRALVTSMLEFVKADVEPQMPLVATRLGEHARGSYRIDVSSAAIKTTGKLWGAVQAYWREYGTKGRSRKLGKALGLSVGQLNKAFNAGAMGGGGEPARPITQTALNASRRFIAFYYDGMANWWKL